MRCKKCSGKFVTHTFDLQAGYHCGLCKMPSRAGKKNKAAEAHDVPLATPAVANA